MFPGSTLRASWPQTPYFLFIELSEENHFIEAFHESLIQTHARLQVSAHVNTPQTNMTRRRTHTVLRVTGVTEPGKLTGLLTQVGWRHSYHRQEVVGRQKHDDGMQEQDGREVRACTYVFATWDAREHIWSIQYTWEESSTDASLISGLRVLQAGYGWDQPNVTTLSWFLTTAVAISEKKPDKVLISVFDDRSNDMAVPPSRTGW